MTCTCECSCDARADWYPAASAQPGICVWCDAGLHGRRYERTYDLPPFDFGLDPNQKVTISISGPERLESQFVDSPENDEK